jgi:hypothetical protein
MKQNHRSYELDQYINQSVRVTFHRGSWIEGLLIYNQKYEAPRYLMRESYYVLTDHGYMAVRKTQVRKVEKITVANV